MLSRKLYLFAITGLFLLITLPVFSHNLPVGGSRWCFGKNIIIGNIDLGPSLLAEIKGIKEGHYDLDSLSVEQLEHIVTDILQPYVNKKLSITVNGETYPIKVNKVVGNGNVYTIWLVVDNVSFKNSENPVRIEYSLLFDETSNAHVNLAYGYLSDATGDALQKVFDFSPPAFQTTFDAKAPVWAVTIPGVAASIGPNDREETRNIPQPQKDIASAPAADNKITTPTGLQKTAAISGRAQGRRSLDNHRTVLSQAHDESKKDDRVPAGPVGKTVWASVGEFILLGIQHILTGYDHIAFLLALIVIGLSIKEVLKIITAFTLAHSITLLLAALQIVSLNSRLVEFVIALSICYVALENLFKKKVHYRWLVTFGFGLIHGFGFASVLQELIVGKTNLLVSVVSFNMGVELGQVMIFLIMLPVLHLLRNKIEFRKVTIATSLAIFLLGFAWLIERGFNLKLLPI
jgi:hydrogenase/urease accessory protein HupE